MLVHSVFPDVDQLDDDTVAKLLDGRDQLGSETGYLMCFTDLKHSRLHPHSISDMADEKYPVPRPALESLPPHIEAELEQGGESMFFARYDRDSHEFYDVALPTDQSDYIEKAAELMTRLDCSLPEALDYIVLESGEYSPKTWSSIRDVRERQVKANADAVRDNLHDRPSE
ncbi:hypothetical protein [Halorientalis persicus]|nr:hypothetical protein [Halorientalis persicus]